jgi:DNA/RNA endonuclease G (NUC1)
MVRTKKFKSPVETPIRIALISGHVALITKEGIELPDQFWKEAYAAGAISGDMESLSTIDEERKLIEEAKAEKLKEEEELKDFLVKIYKDPRSYLDKDNIPLVRKVSGAMGRRIIKSDMLKVWEQVVKENS